MPHTKLFSEYCIPSAQSCVSFITVALKGGMDPYLAQSLVMVHFLISAWTDQSQEISRYIVETGKMMEHIDELCLLRQSTKVCLYI